MSDRDKEASAEHADESKTDDASRAIARFVQYTSPVMLAMLASSTQNAAAICVSACP